MDSVEIWKDIDSYKGLYQISSFGRVKALEKKAGFLTKHERILIPFVKNNGYACIDLRRKGIRRKHHIHRLVAEAFIPNPNNYPCINHIDYNKLNNKVENLEWCTYSHNNTYSNCQNIGGFSRRIPVSQFDKNGKFIKTWESATSAAKELNINNSLITACCKGRVKSAYGYVWRYKS